MSQLHALLLTLGIEGLVGALLLRVWLGARGAVLGRGVLVVLAASLLTHPLAWQANRVWLRGLGFPLRATIIELSVTVVEAAILWRGLAWARDQRQAEPAPGWSRGLIVSLAMNGASFGYGLWRLL